MATYNPEPDFSFWQSKCVLVTGAAGTIGSGVTRELLKVNARSIVCVDRAETPLAELQEFLAQQKSHSHHIYLTDILDNRKMNNLFQQHRPHIVIHCAALKHVPFLEQFPNEAIECNLHGTCQLADLSRKHGVEKFVLISTDKAVEPANVMGFSKRMAELEMKSRHFEHAACRYLTVRFGNVFGSNGSFSQALERKLQPGMEVEITHPDVSRYMISVNKACQLALKVTETGNGGETFVYDMGGPVKIIDMLENLCAIKGVPRESIRVRYTGLRPGDKLAEKLFYDFELPLRKKQEKTYEIPATPFSTDEIFHVNEFLKSMPTNSLREDLYSMAEAIILKHAGHLSTTECERKASLK